MAITIKSVSTGTDNGSTATVSVTTSETPAATQVGDLVVVVHCNDFRDLTNMVAPTATGSPTMTLQGSADGGTNFSHIKVWTYVANTAGAQSISTTETGTHDGDKGLTAYVLGGADTSTPLDGSVVATLSPSTSVNPHVLTGVTTASSNSLLFNHLRTSNGAGTASYTAPGSMTLRYSVNNFTRFAGGTEQLSASGATGTRTWTPASSVPFVAAAFAIKTAAGGTTVNGTATITGAGALTATVTQRATATLAGAGSLTATVVQRATATLAGAGSLSALATQRATAALTGAGVLAAAGSTSGTIGATLTGAGVLSATATQGSSATLTGAATVSAAVTQTGKATLTGAGALTPAGVITGSGVITGAGTLTAPVRLLATATLTGDGALSVSAGGVTSGTASLVGAGVLSINLNPCVTPRPSTGITGHTVTLTPRPDTGITEEPC